MPQVTDLIGRPTSGQQPTPMIAIVVDNVDPDMLGRIKVKFPALQDEPTTFWIRQVTPNGGEERGLYALPEIEDEVIVFFLQGDQNAGMIMGQLWNGVDKPPPEAFEGMPQPSETETGGSLATDTYTAGSTNHDANDRRFWRSRSGHIIGFDDTEGAESVHVWNNTHTLSFVFDTASNLITLANSEGNINIRAKKDILIEAGDNIKWLAGKNIEGESKQNTTHKAGQNYSMEASQNYSAKAGMSAKIESGTDCTVKAGTNATFEGSIGTTVKGGATAKLEGGAMAEVKGGMVKIN